MVYGQPSKEATDTIEWKMPTDTEIRRVSVKSLEGKILAVMFYADENGKQTLLNTAQDSKGAVTVVHGNWQHAKIKHGERLLGIRCLTRKKSLGTVDQLCGIGFIVWNPSFEKI